MTPAGPAPCDAVASLRWASDTEPGIRRRRCGNGFSYTGPDGRPMRDAATLQRIRALAIPPAYRDVWICADARGHVQATARDARGRKQYRYHPDWVAARGATKFDRLRDFSRRLPRLRARVARQLAVPGPPTRGHVLAAVVRLLDITRLRIGNTAYARENGSFGLTTLRRRHVGVRGTELRLSFVGKSGQRHDVRTCDRHVARLVRRCRDLPGRTLFQYLDDAGDVHCIDSGDVNAWLADATGAHVTAKDFRTWHGSVQALQLLLAACRADTPAQPAALVAEVAARLGNTPAVCRKAYIHPAVLACGEALADPEARRRLLARRWVDAPPAVRGLTVAERQLVGLLGAAPPAIDAATNAGRPRQGARLACERTTAIAA